MTTHVLKDIDIARTTIQDAHPLDRVGMSGIECPVMFEINGIPRQMTAGRADAFVSLNEPQKGIHMSRLFLSLTETLSSSPVSPALLSTITNAFLQNHEGISDSAHVKVNFEMMIRRPALLSGNLGWRSYPISLWATANRSQVRHGIELVVRYSSTCPCSAALARQLIQNKFADQFPTAQDIVRDDVLAWLGREESIAGTPHGQRSEGRVRLSLRQPTNNMNFVVETINQLESALATPVQAAVKREDEQEFARLNAENLMFAEDAVRRLAGAVSGNPLFSGTACEVSHFESLHPHEAVAKVATGDLAHHSWL
jgi:GTP cyclohydrolase I